MAFPMPDIPSQHVSPCSEDSDSDDKCDLKSMAQAQTTKLLCFFGLIWIEKGKRTRNELQSTMHICVIAGK